MIAQAIEKTNEIPTPAPIPRGAGWIEVGMAAKRMGCSEQWVRERCAEWQGRGLARLEVPPGGGKARWLICEAADPLLARIKFPEQMIPDTSGLTEKYIAEWGKRIEIYFAWDAAKRAAVRNNGSIVAATEKYLAELAAKGVSVSPVTLYQWHKRYRKKGKEGLIDERWRRIVDDPTEPDLMFKEAARLYLTTSCLSVRICHEMAAQIAKEKGWPVRSLKQVRRHLETIPEPVRILKREGEKAYTDKAEPYLERDYSTLASNEQWNGDHHVFDVRVQVGQTVDPVTGEVRYKHARPWLTSWQDCASRKIVGYVIRDADPDTDAILLAFHRAAIEHGVPEHVYTDNGRDYSSFALHGRTKRQKFEKSPDDGVINGAFATLGVKGHNVKPFRGQSKVIERFHGTVCERFSKLFPTYCGRNPQEKPEGLAEREAAGKAPTMEQFVAAFDGFVRDYNSRPHSGDSMEGKSPDQVWEERLVTKRTLPREQLDFILWKQSRPVVVTQNGIRWNGLTYGQFDLELSRFLRQKVTLRVDPADVSRVAIFTVEGKFITAAKSNQRVPANASPEVLKEAIKRKQRYRKMHREYVTTARLRMHEDLPETMYRVAEERRKQDAGKTVAGDASISPVRTQMEGQLPEIQRSLDALAPRKKASEFSLTEMMEAYPDRESSDDVDLQADRFRKAIFAYEGKAAEETPELGRFVYESPFVKPKRITLLDLVGDDVKREDVA